MSRPLANALLLLTAFIWGCTFVAQATAMEAVGPILFTGLRFLLSALVVLPFAMREGKGGLFPEGRGWLVPAGLLSAVFLAGQITQQIGITGTSVTNAGFLTALYVILVPIFGIVLYRQWPHTIVWPAALLALAGTYLLGGGLEGLTVGDLWILVSAVFWALQVVLVGRVVAHVGRPFFVVFAQSLVGGGVALTAAFVMEPVRMEAIVEILPELFVAGVLSGGLAFSLQAIAQRHTGAADAAVVFSAEAVFAALAAAVLLGERLDGAGWLGCMLILTAVLAVQLLPLMAARGRPREHPATP